MVNAEPAENFWRHDMITVVKLVLVLDVLLSPSSDAAEMELQGHLYKC